MYLIFVPSKDINLKNKQIHVINKIQIRSSNRLSPERWENPEYYRQRGRRYCKSRYKVPLRRRSRLKLTIMTKKEEYRKETGRTPYCWTKDGDYICSGSYNDGYVKWLEKKLTIK